MEKLLGELKGIVRGQVLSDEASLEHYSKDGSIFKVKPWAIVLPRDTSDVVAVVRWLRTKKAEDPQNPMLSLTARGKATDQAGGPLNEGIIIRFPGYLDKILEVGQDFVRVEPGAIFGRVNEELTKHGRFLPPYPASQAFSTIGGAVANNAAGEKSVKYGSTRLYVKSLKMVLSSGSEVTVAPLKHEDLEFKKQQFNFEGDIYREIDELIKKERKLLERTYPKVNKYSTGYNLWEISRQTEEGRIFDLTQLVAGSQGTLGILTEISLWTLPCPKYTGLLLAYFDDLIKSGKATSELVKLEPSALEMVDHFLLKIVNRQKPEMLAGLLPSKMPQIALLCEFDGNDIEVIKSKLNLAAKAVNHTAYSTKASTDPQEQERLWRVRRSALVVIEEIPGKKKALPFIEDVSVPPERFPEYVSRLYEILQKYQVEFAIWGHAGNGNVHVQPFLDIGDPNDRQKLFYIAEETFNLVAELDGVLSAEHNDGLMRTPFLVKIYPPELLALWQKVKKIFDPLNIFNPGKKFPAPWQEGGIDYEYIRTHLRDEYEVGPPPGAKTKEAVT
ncbi:MAG: FAD-binding oxidoreductase [Candidatus Paceibacteria bacterium]